MIYLFPIPHDLLVLFDPLCVFLPDTVSRPQLIGFMKQAQLVNLLLPQRNFRVVGF